MILFAVWMLSAMSFAGWLAWKLTAPWSITLTASSAGSQFYEGMIIHVNGQDRVITAYTGTTLTVKA